MSQEIEHFVYVYRDTDGNPVYFGQGRRATRAASHKHGTHNARLDAWLHSGKNAHTIEIIGPLGSKLIADAIETALISACLPARALRKKLFNEHGGRSEFRFRPYGVPAKFAKSLGNTVRSDELFGICRNNGPLMFVRISQKDFMDSERPGYNVASPPSDAKIRARIEAWWQVATIGRSWACHPDQSPFALLGVTGAPGAQTIIASALIDRSGWSAAETQRGGLLKVPLFRSKVNSGLNALGLRGRPIDRDVGLRFQAIRAGHFRIFTPTGFV